MSGRPLALFGMQASRAYAESVARALEAPLAPHEERSFEDGEHKSRPLQDVRGHDAFVVHALHGDAEQVAAEKLCRLLFFCGALKDAGAERVTAVIPYLCYARKDRRTKPNDPITTRYIAAMFEAVGIDQVIAVEVHNLAAFENAFRVPTRHLESAQLFATYFAVLLGDADVVAVSPDAGGAKRAEQFRAALEERTGRPVNSAYMEKFRSAGVLSGGRLVGEVRGRTAVIVDDLISTGGTLLRAAQACRDAGATAVHAAATHGLFIDGAPELFASDLFDGITVANTVPPFRVRPESTRRLTILDASDMFARAIAACHDAS